jgi:hypothetical protein
MAFGQTRFNRICIPAETAWCRRLPVPRSPCDPAAADGRKARALRFEDHHAKQHAGGLIDIIQRDQTELLAGAQPFGQRRHRPLHRFH